MCTNVDIPHSTAEFSMLFANVTKLNDIAQMTLLAMDDDIKIIAETHLNTKQSKKFSKYASVMMHDATVSPARDTDK